MKLRGSVFSIAVIGLVVSAVLVLMVVRACTAPEERDTESVRSRPDSDSPEEVEAQQRARGSGEGEREPEDGGTVTGKIRFEVTRWDGQRTGAARVRLGREYATERPGCREACVEVRTDELGRGEVEIPNGWPPSDLKIVAEAVDGSAATRSAQRASVGDTVHLQMAPCAEVRGVVVGSPAATRSATVWAYCPDWPESPGPREVHVEEGGVFRVPYVTRYVSLFAEASGWMPSKLVEVEARAGQSHEVVLKLEVRGAAARLRLVDDAGGPLATGSRVLTWTRGHASRTALVEEDGWVSVWGVAGTPMSLLVWPTRRRDGHYRTALLRKSLGPEEWACEPTIEVPRAGAATFEFRDDEGRPLTDMLLRVSSGSANGVDWRVRTDEKGVLPVFRQKAGTAGVYTIRDMYDSVLWEGRILGEEPAPRHQVIAEGITEVRVTLQDDEGHGIRARNVWVGPASQVRPDWTIGRRCGPSYTSFRQSDSTTLHIPRRHRRSERIRVVFSWLSFVDHEIPGSGRMTISPPENSGFIVVQLGRPVPPCTGAIGLHAVEQGTGRRFLADFDEAGRALFVGVRPGMYLWKTIMTTLPAERSGGPFQVSSGRNDLVIR
jgi:hypothetical protein